MREIEKDDCEVFAVNVAVEGGSGYCLLALEAFLEVLGHFSLIIAYCVELLYRNYSGHLIKPVY